MVIIIAIVIIVALRLTTQPSKMTFLKVMVLQVIRLSVQLLVISHLSLMPHLPTSRAVCQRSTVKSLSSVRLYQLYMVDRIRRNWLHFSCLSLLGTTTCRSLFLLFPSLSVQTPVVSSFLPYQSQRVGLLAAGDDADRIYMQLVSNLIGSWEDMQSWVCVFKIHQVFFWSMLQGSPKCIFIFTHTKQTQPGLRLKKYKLKIQCEAKHPALV